MAEDAGAMTTLPASMTLRNAPAVLDELRQSFAAEAQPVWRIDAAQVTQSIFHIYFQ